MKKPQDSKMDPGYELSNEGLLLDLEQIRKLQKINPNVVSWIMLRAEEEQQARHNLDISKLALEEAEQSRLFKIDVLTIISAFILMMACFCHTSFSGQALQPLEVSSLVEP